MTPEEAAAFLRVSPADILRLVESEGLPATRIGPLVRLKKADILAWMDGKSTAVEADASAAFGADAIARPDRCLVLDTAVKREALQSMADCLEATGAVASGGALLRAVLQREAAMSTGIGMGVAIPHARSADVRSVAVAVAASRRDILDYETLDGKPVRILFLIVAPAGQHAEHLRLLSRFSALAKDAGARSRLLEARTPREIYAAMSGLEA